MKKMYKRVVCADGFSVSIRASSTSYCEPQYDSYIGGYTSVELGFPSDPDPFILPYAEDPDSLTETIYGYVPASVVRKMLNAHNGIVSGECPPLAR